MTKKKLDLKDMKLDDEAIKRKRQQLEDFKLTQDALEMQLETDKKTQDKKILERQLRMNIRNAEERIQLTKNNIKVLEKQIREKKEQYL